MNTEQYDNAKNGKRNAVLFYVAAFVSIGLMAWFTLAFFRKHWNFHDVSASMVFIGLGIIASYAAHNKAAKVRCPEMKNRDRPGEWIFAAVLLWAGVMWTLYQVRLFGHLWGIELAVPEQFYTFLASLAAIFGFSSIWNFLPIYNHNRNKTKDNNHDNASK